MPALSHIGSALRHRNYRLYVGGNAVSLIGLWTQRVAVGWLTWELTHSGTWLGAIALADLAPSILIGPFAGVAADRLNQLHVVRAAQVLAMLQAAVLAVLTALDRMDIETLLVLVLANGIVIGFNQPARLALVSSLVARESLSTAIALNSIVFNLARFVGPVVAGLLLVGVGAEAAFAANALSYLAFLLALSLIRLDPDATPTVRRARGSVVAELLEGVAYVVRHPGIGPLLLLVSATGVGVRCYVELLPGIAADVFDGGASELAAFASCIGAGAVLGGLWLAQRGAIALMSRVALLHALLSTVAVTGFASTGSLWLALGLATLSGVFMAVSGVATQTALQLAVSSELRGRVLSLYGIIMRAGPAAGAVLVGGASEVLGLQAALLLGTGAAMLVWAGVWARRRSIARALRTHENRGC